MVCGTRETHGSGTITKSEYSESFKALLIPYSTMQVWPTPYTINCKYLGQVGSFGLPIPTIAYTADVVDLVTP